MAQVDSGSHSMFVVKGFGFKDFREELSPWANLTVSSARHSEVVVTVVRQDHGRPQLLTEES